LKGIKNSKELARFIAEVGVDKKGSDIVMLDLSNISDLVDYFVIITGSSDLHSRAIAEDIIEKLKKRGIHKWHLEGHSYGHWILIDYVDVVVHIFLKEDRDYYSLESLWGDAPTEKIGIESEES
jgi:ribosome-associated protein